MGKHQKLVGGDWCTSLVLFIVGSHIWRLFPWTKAIDQTGRNLCRSPSSLRTV